MTLCRSDDPGWPLSLTRRWDCSEMHDIHDWADPTEVEVELFLAVSQYPFDIKVKKFKPRDGDQLNRIWNDRGRKKTICLAPYALANIYQTSYDFKHYLQKFSASVMGGDDSNQYAHTNTDPIITETFRMATLYAERLKERVATVQ